LLRGELTHEFSLLPGSSHYGTIDLQNTGTQIEEVKLYQTDYRSSGDGKSFYEDPGTNPRSNASWISLSPRRFFVPPGETYTISYAISIPDDETMEGTYWSVLMIEPVPPESPESQQADPSETSVGIRTVLRYGLRFVTHIGDTGTVSPEITNAVLNVGPEIPELKLTVANSGTRALKLDVWAELYDAAGQLANRLDAVSGGVFPDSSRRFLIKLRDVEPGDYTALVVLDAGENDVFGVSLPLALP